MIRLDTPRRWDIVGPTLWLAGVGTGFEATINYRVSDGHYELSSYITVGGGSGEHAQFIKKISLGTEDWQLDRLFVDVYEASAKDGSDLYKTTREVIYGPRIVPGYYGYRRHKFKSGDTLYSIAIEHGVQVYHITRANPQIDLTILYPGEILRVPVGM